MSKSALVILAPGAEEMEFIITTGVLRRAGVSVTVAGVTDALQVRCSSDIVIVADTILEDAKTMIFDAVVLPGGPCASETLIKSPLVGEILKKQASEGRIIAATYDAPTALASNYILVGRKVTSFPAVKGQLETIYEYVEHERVVQDGNLITSSGPATAFDFALKVAGSLVGEEEVALATKDMQF